MPESIPDIIIRLARQHLDDVAAKRQAAIQVDLPAVAESLPDSPTDSPVVPNADVAPVGDSENILNAPHRPDAAISAVPASDFTREAPAAAPQSFLPDNSPGTVAAPELMPIEQLPVSSPALFDFPAEPGGWPTLDDRPAPAVVPPDPARQFDSPAPAWTDQAASPHDDSATRLEQVTRDMEASLTRLLTTQIEALTHLRERLEEHERRWIEQTGARRAAM